MQRRAASRSSVQERGLDDFAAGREDKFEAGAVLDIGHHRPVVVVGGGDFGQRCRDGDAVEVDVGLARGAARVAEDAERDALPAFGMDGAGQERAPLQLLSVLGGFWETGKANTEGEMARGDDRGIADGIGAFVDREGNGGAVRPWRMVVAVDDGVRVAGEMLRRQ